ncbi:hypothetical protein GCM10025331_68270 [Actinoplanes utahensis]|nr:hypothetical protein Aut01nite_00850 [Actinoplanes utahensis]
MPSVSQPGGPAIEFAAATGSAVPGQPRPGDPAPCAGYWQPQCKGEEPRHLTKHRKIPKCGRGHPVEYWNLIEPDGRRRGY